jgi:hypothetical protein
MVIVVVLQARMEAVVVVSWNGAVLDAEGRSLG